MLSQEMLLLLALVGLATLLLPLPRWQSLLLRLSSLGLRLIGFGIVVAAAVLCFVVGQSPAELAESINSPGTLTGKQPTDWLILAALLIAILMPLAAFLDFSRRLLRSSRQTEELLASLRRTSSLMREALDRDAGPGAVLTPQRSAELRDALAGCSDTVAKTREPATPREKKSLVRKPLAQLID